MTFTPDAQVWPLLTDLASCLCREITDAGLPEPCFCGVLPGAQVALDYCTSCDDGRCGMAWTRLAAILPVLSETPVPRRCQVGLVISIEAGVVRCAPMPDDDGNPPSMAEQFEATALQMADQAAIQRALLCCSGIEAPVLGAYQPLGPLGGCVGGSWTANFTLY